MASQKAFGVRVDSSLGLTQRVLPKHPEWTGETRVRFTDFQVNEICKDGTVLHLTDTRLPEERQPKKENNDQTAPKEEAKDQQEAQESQKPAEEAPEISEEDLKTMTDLTSEDFANQLVAIFKASFTHQPIPEPARTQPIEDKDQRGQIHQNVRRIFHSLIETIADTKDVPAGAPAPIVAKGHHPKPKSKNKPGNRNNRRGGGGRQGPINAPGEGEYLHFTLFKENRDTMDAIRQISNILRLRPQNFTFSGTKDRRASTTQRCAVRRVKAHSLVGANKVLRGAVTGDYRYEDKPLYLGGLRGNEFVVVIKNCRMTQGADGLDLDGQEAAIRTRVNEALGHMQSKGWLNYYGHQRFGTYIAGTHEVGKAILGRDYEEAVSLIMAYDEATANKAEDLADSQANGQQQQPGQSVPAHVRDERKRAQACKLFQEGGSADTALQILPRRFTGEQSVMRHLGRDETTRKDFLGSLLSIPRQLRSMYLHAYQSFVWNHAVSRRWELYGEEVREGDLVIDSNATTNDEGQGKANANGDGDEGDDTSEIAAEITARAVTAEEAVSGRFTIFDVVLPTPGHNVTYPTNEIGQFYKDFMGRPENGELDPDDMVRKQGDFSLPGNYRKIVARFLAEPSAEVKRYAHDNDQMHPTDLDKVKAAQKEKATTEAAAATTTATAAGGEGEGEEKKRKREGDGSEDREDDSKKAKGDDADKARDVEGDTVMGEHGQVDAQQKIAVVARFQLGKSAYATVAMREFMTTAENEQKGEES